MKINLLRGRFAVCRLPAGTAIPHWATAGPFYAVTGTADEVSVVCQQEGVPAGVEHAAGWRLLQVQGPLAFDEIGVLASLAGPLAAAGIPILAIGTYDTDYLLVREDHLPEALAILAESGHAIASQSIPTASEPQQAKGRQR